MMFKQHKRKATFLVVGSGVGLFAALAYAGTANLSNTFAPGTPISSAEVNQNFSDLQTAINDNDSRLSVLESPTGSSSVTIDCNTASPGAIQNALDNAQPGGNLTITIDGTCSENIVIRRDDVTLAGGIGGGINAATSLQPAIAIEGASSVQINGLTVSGGLNGIHAEMNAVVSLAGNTVSGAVLDPGSAVPTGAALFVDVGSAVEIADNNNLTGSSADGAVAAFVFRSSHVKLVGNNNSIIAGTPQGLDETAALGVSHGSSFIQEVAGTGVVITGTIESEASSQVFMRSGTINGAMEIFGGASIALFPDAANAMTVTSDLIDMGVGSRLDLGDAGAPVTINGTVSGTMRILDHATLMMFSGSTINMNVEMFRASSIDADEGSTIGGDLNINNYSSAVFNAVPASAVGGNVICSNSEAYSFDLSQNFTDLCNSI